MASIPETQEETTTFDAPLNERPVPRWDGLGVLLMPLASLKLTVAMFAASIFIVFAGTLAQVDHDIWYVIDEYFRVDMQSLITNTFPYFHYQELLVFIKFEVFFPKSFFPDNPVLSEQWQWAEPFILKGTPKILRGQELPFPKGWTIGIVMAINLLAAHTLRFKVQASGSRLTIGSIVLAIWLHPDVFGDSQRFQSRWPSSESIDFLRQPSTSDVDDDLRLLWCYVLQCDRRRQASASLAEYYWDRSADMYGRVYRDLGII